MSIGKKILSWLLGFIFASATGIYSYAIYMEDRQSKKVDEGVARVQTSIEKMITQGRTESSERIMVTNMRIDTVISDHKSDMDKLENLGRKVAKLEQKIDDQTDKLDFAIKLLQQHRVLVDSNPPMITESK